MATNRVSMECYEHNVSKISRNNAEFSISRFSSNRLLEYNHTLIQNDEFSSNWTPVTVMQFFYIWILDNGWVFNQVHHQETFLVCTIWCLPCCIAWKFSAVCIGEDNIWICRCPVSSCSEIWSIDLGLKFFNDSFLINIKRSWTQLINDAEVFPGIPAFIRWKKSSSERLRKIFSVKLNIVVCL